MDKLTYYDTLSNLVPGLVLVWCFAVLGPGSQGAIPGFLTGNDIVDAVLLIAVSFVLGHTLQFLSKCSIEPLLKHLFWGGQFFSDIFLIAASKRCPEVELARYISFAQDTLGFSEEQLEILVDGEALSDRTKRRKATSLSHAIYRTIDAETQDASLAMKAHVQNSFYSFFRNLSVLFLMLGAVNIVTFMLGAAPLRKTLLLMLLNFALFDIFLLRARSRGELYVKGLFWSCGGLQDLAEPST
jgi:hypothetical protein